MIWQDVFYLILLFLSIIGAFCVAQSFEKKVGIDSPQHLYLTTLLLTTWSVTIVGYGFVFSKNFTLYWTSPIWAFLIISGAVCAAKTKISGIWSFIERIRPAKNRLLKWSILFAIGMCVLQSIRLLLLPPVQWDSLTYHYLKAADFYQMGGMSERIQPDAWTYYSYFPDLGSLLLSGPMLLTRSDLAANVPSLIFWWGLAIAIYRTFDEICESRLRTAVATMLVFFYPGLWHLGGTGYVDHLLTFFITAGSLFAFHFNKTGRFYFAFLSLAGFALAVATKSSGLVALALGGLWVVGGLIQYRKSISLLQLLGCVLALVPVLPYFVRGLRDHANPIYPFPLEIGGLKLLGNDLLIETLRLELPLISSIRAGDRFEMMWALMIAPTGFGMGLPIFLFGFLVGIVMSVRAKRCPYGLNLLVFWTVLGGILAYQVLFGSLSVGQQTKWLASSSRLIPAAYFSVVAWTATIQDRRASWIFWLGTFFAVGSIVRSFLLTWSDLEVVLVTVVGIGVLLTVLAFKSSRKWPGILVLMMVLVVFASLRDHFRWELLSEAKAHEAWNPPDDKERLEEIFEMLDDGPAYKVAVTAGPFATGHNWFVYPLLGSRLQNRVVYVPIGRDNEEVSHLDPIEMGKDLDADAWIARIRFEAPDFLVILPPPSVEYLIADRVFSRVPLGAPGYSLIYDLRVTNYLGESSGSFAPAHELNRP